MINENFRFYLAFLTFSLSGMLLFGQSNEVYGLNTFSNTKYDVDINIILSGSDSFYYLSQDIDYIGGNYVSLILSIGFFEDKNDKIILNDLFYGLKIIIKKRGDAIIVKKGFNAIQNKRLSRIDVYDFEFNKEDYIEDKGCDTINIVKGDSLIFGKYFDKESYCCYNQGECYLELKKNGKYYQYEWGELFSRGRWKREGARLILYDKDLDFDYEIVIRSDGTLYAAKVFPYTLGTILSPR